RSPPAKLPALFQGAGLSEKRRSLVHGIMYLVTRTFNCTQFGLSFTAKALSARKETAVYCGGPRRPELCFSRTSTFLRVVMRGGKMQATGRFLIERLILFSVISLTLTRSGIAQDPFEIQVYEYETVPKGEWNLETHLNYIARGTRA